MIARHTRHLLLLAVLCCLIQGAAAVQTVEINDIQYFEYNVSAPGLTIPQINLYGLREGLTTVYLDAYGEPYLLEVDCSREGWWDAWWVWEVSLTYPNGTVSSERLKNLSPLAHDYDLYIQYVIGEATSILVADVYVDLLPMKVLYGTPAFSDRQFVAFSSVSVSAPDPCGAKIFELTPNEFEKMKAGDIFWQLGQTVKNVAADFFSWTWDGILWSVEKIPVLGPYLSAILELSGALVGEIVAWGMFVLENIEVIMLFAEGLILAEALLSPRSRTLMGLLSRIVENHISVVKFTIRMLNHAITIFLRFIDTIAKIVQTLKPI